MTRAHRSINRFHLVHHTETVIKLLLVLVTGEETIKKLPPLSTCNSSARAPMKKTAKKARITPINPPTMYVRPWYLSMRLATVRHLSTGISQWIFGGGIKKY